MKYCFRLFIGFLLLQTSNSFAQDKATFYADTSYLHGNWRKKPFTGFMKWTIQNKTIGWGETLEVEVTPNQIDTLFFQRNSESEVDTIICDIKKPRAYRIMFNACCGAFNIRSADKNGINSEIKIELTSKVEDSTLVATNAETGAFIKKKSTPTFESICASAMASNISHISLGEIGPCDEIDDCEGWFCNYSKDDEESYSDNLGFKKKYFTFRYMPLNSKPQVIIYNIDKKELTFKY